MKSMDEIINKFRQQGYKITPQRRAIFEVIYNNGDHPNTEDIYNLLKEKMPDISLTTVYNTLKELNALGFIDVVRNVGDGSIRYDTRIDNHDHLYCLQCNRIIDIEREITDIKISEDEAKGFQIIKQQVTYSGYCPACQKNKQKSGKG
ncbi:MAG TPA: transcriptional repressor [Anaerolineaceae bacterium]|nr:transcriptional repressor [Anaerolineaceae bacterium]